MRRSLCWALPALVVLAVVFAVMLAFLPGTAHAGSRRSKRDKGAKPSESVAILALDIQGGAQAQIEKLTQERIADSLEIENLSAVSHDEVKRALRKQGELAECTTPACVKEMVDLVGAERLIKLKIEASGGAYTYEIQLLSADGPPRTQSGTCPVCTVSEACEQIGMAVAAFVIAPPEAPPDKTGEPTVELLTDPPGARLTIDGKDIGIAPYRDTLAPGSHKVVATLDGYEIAETTIDVAEGKSEAQRFEVKLVARAPVTPRSRPYRIYKWVGAGATVAALATGVTWIAIDSKGTCSDLEVCPELYDTKLQGIVALGAGVGIGAFTTWMFLRDSKDSRESQVLVAPAAGGGAVGSLRLRF